MITKEDNFQKIISDNSERILRICKYYSLNVAEQQDMYQEILINIWKSLENFRGDSSINTWIYRVAVNTSLSYTGKAFQEMRLFVTTENQNLNSIINEEFLDEKELWEERFERLQVELNQTSVIDKILISLMLEGLSMKNISDIIGITESNVKVKIHRIKENLRLKLQGELR